MIVTSCSSDVLLARFILCPTICARLLLSNLWRGNKVVSCRQSSILTCTLYDTTILYSHPVLLLSFVTLCCSHGELVSCAWRVNTEASYRQASLEGWKTIDHQLSGTPGYTQKDFPGFDTLFPDNPPPQTFISFLPLCCFVLAPCLNKAGSNSKCVSLKRGFGMAY